MEINWTDFFPNKIWVKIWVKIFSYFKLHYLLQSRLINHYFEELINSKKWPHLMVKIRDDISTNIVSKLGNYYMLNLSGCKNIIDKSVCKLGNCHTINLS